MLLPHDPPLLFLHYLHAESGCVNMKPTKWQKKKKMQSMHRVKGKCDECWVWLRQVLICCLESCPGCYRSFMANLSLVSLESVTRRVITSPSLTKTRPNPQTEASANENTHTAQRTLVFWWVQTYEHSSGTS